MKSSLHKHPAFEGMNRNSRSGPCFDANAAHAADAYAADTLCFSTFQVDREKSCKVSLKLQKKTKMGISGVDKCIQMIVYIVIICI